MSDRWERSEDDEFSYWFAVENKLYWLWINDPPKDIGERNRMSDPYLPREQ